MINNAMVVFIAAITAIVVMVFVVLLNNKPAHGSAVCLTKSEARKLWPRQHLYWYSKDHCWSDRRGKPRNLRYDLIRENHAESKSLPPAPSPKSGGNGDRVEPPRNPVPTFRDSNGNRPIIMPPLKQRMDSVHAEFLTAYPATRWPLLIDIDQEDECCWPDLRQLAMEELARRIRENRGIGGP